MDNMEDGRALAHSIVNVANGAGTKTKAVLTDMNQVLGKNVGNAVEVAEAVEYLQGKNIDPRLHQVTMELCAELLVISKLAQNLEEAKQKLEKVLSSGKAAEIFARMVSALGGPKDFVENYEKYLPKAKIIKPLFAKQSGYAEAMQTRNIGLSVIGLKGGRIRSDQKLDYATGYSQFCQIGDWVDGQKPLCFIHAQTEADWQAAAQELLSNIKISQEGPKLLPTIIEKIA